MTVRQELRMVEEAILSVTSMTLSATTMAATGTRGVTVIVASVLST